MEQWSFSKAVNSSFDCYGLEEVWDTISAKMFESIDEETNADFLSCLLKLIYKASYEIFESLVLALMGIIA